MKCIRPSLYQERLPFQLVPFQKVVSTFGGRVHPGTIAYGFNSFVQRFNSLRPKIVRSGAAFTLERLCIVPTLSV